MFRSDNDMFYDRYTEKFSGFDHSPGKNQVSVRWRRIIGDMIVAQNNTAGIGQDGRLKDFSAGADCHIHDADGGADGSQGGHDDGQHGVLHLALQLGVGEHVLQGQRSGVDIVVLGGPHAEDGADEGGGRCCRCQILRQAVELLPGSQPTEARREAGQLDGL